MIPFFQNLARRAAGLPLELPVVPAAAPAETLLLGADAISEQLQREPAAISTPVPPAAPAIAGPAAPPTAAPTVAAPSPPPEVNRVEPARSQMSAPEKASAPRSLLPPPERVIDQLRPPRPPRPPVPAGPPAEHLEPVKPRIIPQRPPAAPPVPAPMAAAPAPPSVVVKSRESLTPHARSEEPVIELAVPRREAPRRATLRSLEEVAETGLATPRGMPARDETLPQESLPTFEPRHLVELAVPPVAAPDAEKVLAASPAVSLARPSPVEVHIGTIEVRVQAPPALPPVRPAPALADGFDDYAALRGHAGAGA
jgi:hypothetical protein